MEISSLLPYKTSLYLLREVFPHSRKRAVQEELVYVYPNKKPGTYNEHVLPFISEHWSIDNALTKSESLRKAVARLKKIV